MYVFTLQMSELHEDGTLLKGHRVDLMQVLAALKTKLETSNLLT